jgi:hypothetical protein
MFHAESYSKADWLEVPLLPKNIREQAQQIVERKKSGAVKMFDSKMFEND